MCQLLLIHPRLSHLSNNRSINLNVFEHVRILGEQNDDRRLRIIGRIKNVLLDITLKDILSEKGRIHQSSVSFIPIMGTLTNQCL